MDEMIAGIIFLIFLIAGIILLLRELWTWYWKINSIIRNQEALNRSLDDIKTAVLLQTSQINKQLLEIANCLKGDDKENIEINKSLPEENKTI